MRFADVVSDLKKMIGTQLPSIQKGSEITLLTINEENGTIRLETSARAFRSRPLKELENIWTALCSGKPVHVDSVLGGSGSSRNQPETILANLPYVEWLRFNGKKHLILNKKHTHSLGTLKQMDSLAVEHLKQQLARDAENEARKLLSQIIVVSGNLREHALLFEHCSGTPGKAVQQGAYEFFTNQQCILLVSEDVAPDMLVPGTYPVLSHACPEKSTKDISLLGRKYSLYQKDGAAFLFCAS